MKSEKRILNSDLRFGLVGKRLDYSFSQNYFTQKFEQHFINASYQNFEMQDLNSLKKTIQDYNLSGFNVTVPFKEKIIPLLHSLSENAAKIKAVNCVEITKDNKWIGHNTDVIGFEKSILNLIKNKRPCALIFGTGGASKAVQQALKILNINFLLVSRNAHPDCLQYEELNESVLLKNTLLINTTPLGTSPYIKECVDIPYEHITANHYCFDLTYNPERSEFLSRAFKQGAKIKNGFEMLEIQAEESWKIWRGK